MKKTSDDSHLSMAYNSKGKLSKFMLMSLFCFVEIVIVAVIVNPTMEEVRIGNSFKYSCE